MMKNAARPLSRDATTQLPIVPAAGDGRSRPNCAVLVAASTPPCNANAATTASPVRSVDMCPPAAIDIPVRSGNRSCPNAAKRRRARDNRALLIMRIAYFSETYPPEINGVSLTVERCVRHMRRQGNSVLLCRPRQPGEAPRDDAEEWRTPGIALPMYPEVRTGLVLTPNVRKRLDAFEPDLVHVATQGLLGRTAVSAARELLIPVTSDFRTNFHAYCGHYGLRLASGVVMRYLRNFHNHTAATFVPSRELRAQLEARGFERVEVMSRGVDAQGFTPRKRSRDLRLFWDAADDTPVLLYVG